VFAVGLAERLVSGSHHRVSRFHNEKGERVDAIGLLYAPRAFGSAVLRSFFGYRPARPTLSYRATKVIARLLTPASVVVEFGSGMSTPWLAARCRWLLSIEDQAEWHRAVERLLAARGLTNVRHELREAADYARLDDLGDGSVDFALVDGSFRATCVASVLPKVRRGGALYLDNSDKDMLIPDGDVRRAEALVRRAAETRGGRLHAFTDFSPTNFFVEEGLLAVL